MKNSKLSLLLSLSLLILYSCNEEQVFDDASTPTSVDFRNSLDRYNASEIQQKFSSRDYNVNWKEEADVKLIYSVGSHTDQTYTIGFKPTYLGDLRDIMAELNLTSTEWQSIQEEVIDVIERNPNNTIVRRMDKLPHIVAQITDMETIKILKNMDEIRYVAPMDNFFYLQDNDLGGGIISNRPDLYRGIDFLGSVGCTCDIGVPFNEDDAVEILSPFNGILPWNYSHHNIDLNSWDIADGLGVGVAVIDTGVSDDQENLGVDFNSFPSSSSRIIERHNMLNYYLGNGNVIRQDHTLNAHDRCGHGTKMAGLIGAPMGMDGNSVGVAPNSNLYIYRAVFNPIIDITYEVMAVADAIMHAADNSGVDIISMSIGEPLGGRSPMIEEAVCYADGQGKMMICAAGTATDSDLGFLTGVVYPASDPFTIAATGVRFPINTYPGALTENDVPCSTCFTGDEVDFSVIMQRQFDQTVVGLTYSGRTTLAITCDGDDPVYSSGTSSATATLAGMAAVIWEDQGINASNFSVLSAMINASSNSTDIHSRFGFGWIDLQQALEQ